MTHRVRVCLLCAQNPGIDQEPWCLPVAPECNKHPLDRAMYSTPGPNDLSHVERVSCLRCECLW